MKDLFPKTDGKRRFKISSFLSFWIVHSIESLLFWHSSYDNLSLGYFSAQP